jgi:hypothetical protein
MLQNHTAARSAQHILNHVTHLSLHPLCTYASTSPQLCANAVHLNPQVSYSALLHGFKLSNIRLNNKMLSQLALHEPFSFKALVDQVKFMKGMLPGQKAAEQSA